MPESFFQLVECASDLILIVAEGRIVYANPAFAAKLGYPREALQGRPATELAHPDERESVSGRIRQTLTGAKQQALRRRLVDRAGGEVIIDASTFPIEFNGTPAAVLVGHDVTDQVRLEQARQRREADLIALVDSMPGAVLVHERGTILYVNAGFERLFAIPAREAVGAPVASFVPASLHAELAEGLRHFAESGEVLTPRQILMQRRDGSTVTVEISGIALPFEDRSARLVYIVDVTGRNATERWLRALVESSPLAVCSVDAQARIVSWNRAAESIFGWERAGRVPSPREVPPETVERLRELCVAAARDGFAESERDLVRSSDGRQMRVRSSVAPLRDPEGRVEGYVLTTADITEAHRSAEAQRLAAEEWQATFDAVDAPTLLLEGASRQIARINSAALQLAGRREQHLGVLARQEPWATAARLVEISAASGAPALDQVAEQDRVWLASASPLPHGRFVVTIRDVTRLSRLRDSLRKSEAMSAMGALVAGVAHEVRNPLFGMSATLDAMEQAFGTDAKQEPFLRAMRRELDRISTLMRDLLEYGRPPAIELVMDALAPVVALAARSCLPAAEMASVRIENEVSADAGSLPMDAGRLAQVFQNLIENAVQHSPAGGVVRIRAERRPREAAVSVVDSGAGFHPADLPRIFEPFFSRRRGGTGLGLSIVQRIVEQHGGRIEARNRPEGGADVSVILPLP